MKFKVGDIVKLTNKRPIGWNSEGDMDKFLGSIQKVVYVDDERVKFENEETKSWYFNVTDIAEIIYYFEVGDIVKINKEATIENFTKDNWGGCRRSTLSFIEEDGSYDKTYKVEEVGDTYIKVENKTQLINKNIMEIVNKKEIKKMTLAQICKELGYDIQIIKEEY